MILNHHEIGKTNTGVEIYQLILLQDHKLHHSMRNWHEQRKENVEILNSVVDPKLFP